MEPSKPQDWNRREWLGVALLTVIGLGLRLWPVGRLGLIHFDEGIYALAATWSLQPKGLSAIDPSLIPYAPPGFPILGGLAYWLLGRSDGAMIGVSQLAGTLTIPVVGWLARRTFGQGAGFAAAAFCAFSGPHIAFSRMALTDASFLLAWLLALGAGMRFLERPGLGRAVAMGLGVGVAQQFKYNGWLTGGIVVASALLGILIRPEERKFGSILRTFGWGGVAAGVAWLVVWPWFAFVEGHGGYPALLRHQQSYLGGVGDWASHFMIQSRQSVALSGGVGLLLTSLISAFLVAIVAPGPAWTSALKSLSIAGRSLMTLALGILAWGFLEPPYLLGVLLLSWLLGLPSGRFVRDFGQPTPTARLLGVWWLILSVMTPFYHPYARLWLPYHAVHWLLLGWLLAEGLPSIPVAFRRWAQLSPLPPKVVALQAGLWIALLLAGSVALSWGTAKLRRAEDQPGLMAPSDSLYRAAVRIADGLPGEVKGLRVLARPPMTYYLAGRIPIFAMAGSDDLLRGGDRSTWALVDSAILRSEAGRGAGSLDRSLFNRFADRWEVVEEYPTILSLPTLLDLDPGAALRPDADRSCPLWLLRPRNSKGPP